MADRLICLNGINALTGQYLTAPLTELDATAIARGEPPPGDRPDWLKRLTDFANDKLFGLPVDDDPTSVADAGWAVVFPAGSDEIKKRLKPLLDLRREQTDPTKYKELDYNGESREAWLKRFGAAGANVEPTKVPYYVLLVGGPEKIPFSFQYELDVDYAVGRIAFTDLDDYARYAESVVAYETGKKPRRAREVVFWGTRHEGDGATQLSADYLVNPLANGVPGLGGAANQKPIAEVRKFGQRLVLGEDATRAALQEVLVESAPSVLFTASHGMGGWPKGDPRQLSSQGALLCQNWPGFGRIAPEHYLAAADVPDDTDLQGMVAFVFACYGAGTPRYDEYLKNTAAGPAEIAAAPFVSALSQKLLRCGALAVIGHIERAWAFSIQPEGVGPTQQPFRNFLGRVLNGEPVGHATRDFSERYATASVVIANKLNPNQPGARLAVDSELVWAWVDRNDAQNYVLIGDPAVRLAVDRLAAPKKKAAKPAKPAKPAKAAKPPKAPAKKPAKKPAVEVGEPTRTVFTVPAEFVDVTDYTFQDAASRRRVTVVPLKAVASDAELAAAATAYVDQAKSVLSVHGEKVGAVEKRANGSFVPAEFVIDPDGPAETTAFRTRIGFLRFNEGSGAQIVLTAPLDDAEADKLFDRAVNGSRPTGGAAEPGPVAFALPGDGPAIDRVAGGVAIDLDPAFADPPAFQFRSEDGVVHVEIETAGSSAPAAFAAPAESGNGRRTATAAGDLDGGPVTFELPPDPWAAAAPAGPTSFAAPGSADDVIGGLRLVVRSTDPARGREVRRRWAEQLRPPS